MLCLKLLFWALSHWRMSGQWTMKDTLKVLNISYIQMIILQTHTDEMKEKNMLTKRKRGKEHVN